MADTRLVLCKAVDAWSGDEGEVGTVPFPPEVQDEPGEEFWRTATVRFVLEPEVEDGSPVEEDGSPVEEDGSPVEEDGSPVEEDGSPVEEDGSPVKEDGSPVEEDGSPVEEDGSPVEEDGSPVEEDGSAVEEDGSPVEEDGPAGLSDITAEKVDMVETTPHLLTSLLYGTCEFLGVTGCSEVVFIHSKASNLLVDSCMTLELIA